MRCNESDLQRKASVHVAEWIDHRAKSMRQFAADKKRRFAANKKRKRATHSEQVTPEQRNSGSTLTKRGRRLYLIS